MRTSSSEDLALWMEWAKATAEDRVVPRCDWLLAATRREALCSQCNVVLLDRIATLLLAEYERRLGETTDGAIVDVDSFLVAISEWQFAVIKAYIYDGRADERRVGLLWQTFCLARSCVVAERDERLRHEWFMFALLSLGALIENQENVVMAFARELDITPVISQRGGQARGPWKPERALASRIRRVGADLNAFCFESLREASVQAWRGWNRAARQLALYGAGQSWARTAASGVEISRAGIAALDGELCRSLPGHIGAESFRALADTLRTQLQVWRARARAKEPMAVTRHHDIQEALGADAAVLMLRRAPGESAEYRELRSRHAACRAALELAYGDSVGALVVLCEEGVGVDDPGSPSSMGVESEQYSALRDTFAYGLRSGWTEHVPDLLGSALPEVDES